MESSSTYTDRNKDKAGRERAQASDGPGLWTYPCNWMESSGSEAGMCRVLIDPSGQFPILCPLSPFLLVFSQRATCRQKSRWKTLQTVSSASESFPTHRVKWDEADPCPMMARACLFRSSSCNFLWAGFSSVHGGVDVCLPAPVCPPLCAFPSQTTSQDATMQRPSKKKTIPCSFPKQTRRPKTQDSIT